MKPLRLAFQFLAIASIALAVFQLVIAARNIESPDNDAVRLAGLGLPLMFLAFLNLVVWTQEAPRRNTRMFTHLANGLLLMASVLVLRAVPQGFAFMVTGCTASLAAISLWAEFKCRQ